MDWKIRNLEEEGARKMKRLVDHFMEHLIGFPLPDERKARIEEGIYEYLKDIGIHVGQMEEKSIFHQEFARFSLMPQATFCAYFETYTVRESLLRLREFCQESVRLKVLDNVSISEQNYEKIMEEFFTLAKDLSLDLRYTSWLEELVEGMTSDLCFALNSKE